MSAVAVLLHAQVDAYFAGDPRSYWIMFLPLPLLPRARSGIPWPLPRALLPLGGLTLLAGAALLLRGQDALGLLLGWHWAPCGARVWLPLISGGTPGRARGALRPVIIARLQPLRV